MQGKATDSYVVETAIKAAIDRMIQEEVAAALAGIEARVRERLPEIVSSIGIQVAQYVDVSSMGNLINIRIQLDKKP